MRLEFNVLIPDSMLSQTNVKPVATGADICGFSVSADVGECYICECQSERSGVGRNEV